MGKQLIIVESPAKVKTIKKILGSQYLVEASVGHIRDLPPNGLGVDESKNYEPTYIVIKGKQDVVNKLCHAAESADTVWLAPDPDREGEAIAWHIATLLRQKVKNCQIHRIQFNEITERAIKEALKHPRDLDEHLFAAQQARRILDRLVGYKLSPLLWKTVKRGISAGRVQSVALKLVVEREIEREQFQSEEYWTFKAHLKADLPPTFVADLTHVNNKKVHIPNANVALEIENAIKDLPFMVKSFTEKEREKAAPPPFITSTLQQTANQRLGYTAKRTMNIAQKLYEGVDLQGDTIALITYMRTDSTRLAEEAVEAAATFILDNYGKEFCATGAKKAKAKARIQDAHEAIRPVDVFRTPASLKSQLAPEQYALYNLIWSRFVASQMSKAKFLDHLATIECGISTWQAKGERLIFPGFLKVLGTNKEDAVPNLPPLKEGQQLKLEKLDKEQKFTQPPARYNEASLVRKLEELGIGRPSTYASIISTLLDRDYVILKEKQFLPTELGRIVCKQLSEYFKQLMDSNFTAQMEESLDGVADGKENWQNLMQSFMSEFSPALSNAASTMPSVKNGISVDLQCPKCQSPLLIKFGKFGPFLACSAGANNCDYTANFSRDEQGQIVLLEEEVKEAPSVGICPECGKNLVVKLAKNGGRFIACTGWPDCHYTMSVGTGVQCPDCGKGQIVEKTSRKGKVFYACDQYPQCNFATWNRPIAEVCPKCGHPYLEEKKSRSRTQIICPNKECGFKKDD